MNQTPISPDKLAERELFTRWMLGHREAADFLVLLTDAAHVWDDLVDGDAPISEATINAGFEAILLDLPRDPFYAQHFARLHPILEISIVNWRIANRLELSSPLNDETAFHIAFILRSAYADLATMAALIVGGRDWAVGIGEEIRRAWHAEGFDHYFASLFNEPRVQRHSAGLTAGAKE